MAGYWPQSNTQINDRTTGLPLVGASLYFFLGGTSTPMVVYTTAALSTAHTQPIQSDANGMWPAVFFPETDGSSYRARALTPTGQALFDVTAEVTWQPPAAAATPSIDTTGVASTGMLIDSMSTTVPSGWLPCNGRTFGSASSGADYSANDAQSLFIVLWPILNATVSGGAGVSGLADWQANKTMQLPNIQGRARVTLDQYAGGTAANIIAGLTGAGTTGGAATVTLDATQIPGHTHTGTTESNGAHVHGNGATGFATGSGGGSVGQIVTITNTASAGDHTHTFTTSSTGGGGAHNNLQPYFSVATYIKK